MSPESRDGEIVFLFQLFFYHCPLSGRRLSLHVVEVEQFPPQGGVVLEVLLDSIIDLNLGIGAARIELLHDPLEKDLLERIVLREILMLHALAEELLLIDTEHDSL